MQSAGAGLAEPCLGFLGRFRLQRRLLHRRDRRGLVFQATFRFRQQHVGNAFLFDALGKGLLDQAFGLAVFILAELQTAGRKAGSPSVASGTALL